MPQAVAAATPAASPTTTPTPQTPGSAEPTFEDILQFDPFDDAGGDTAPQGDQSGAGDGQQQPTVQPGGEGAPAQQQGQPPTPSPTPAAPQVQQPPTVDQQTLQNLIRQQTQELTTALRQPAQTPQQDQRPQAKFNLGVPPQLTQALRSEDPKEFEAGIGALINGVANHVWNNVMEHITQQVVPTVPQMIERYVSNARQQEQVATDFYGKYQTLSNPALKPLVQQVGTQIASEWAQQGKNLAWSQELRDAIAERIFTLIPALRPQAATQTATPAPPTRRFVANGGGPGPSNVSNTEKDFMEVLFGGR